MTIELANAKRQLPASLCLCLLLAILVGCSVASAGETSPNIVLIVADDLGYGDLGCYGSKFNQTPNIDRLAATGLRFTDFHSNGPMCTPTRAAMLTGQYQQRFGRNFDGALSGKSDRNRGLPLEAVTVAEVLKGQDYATACFGKWHLGYVPPWLPTSQGFDEFRGLGSGDGDHHTHVDRSGREDWWHNNRLDMEEGYTAELLTKYSVDFIERHQNGPFFLYVPHLAIHFPWQGPADPPHRKVGTDYWNDKWGVIPEPGNVRPHIRAMVQSIDQSVGLIVATLKRLELDRRTLVVFTSDNGGYLTYAPNFREISSNGPWRAQKGSIYEGGHRVPAIFHWPGRIAADVTDQTAISIDMLPTIAAITKADTGGLALDGVDLGPLLFRGEPLPRRTLFWRKGTQKAVRRGPWKLAVEQRNRVELYNLHHDMGERNDVADDKPELVKELGLAWDAWEADVNRSAEVYREK
jgi:arylsulfatase A